MEVESIVRDALAMSNQSYILLTGIIQDDSIATDIMEAEHSLQSLQSQMEELAEEADKALKEAKRLYVSTQPTRGANLTLPPNLTESQPEGWNNFTAEIENLESALQIKDQEIEKLLLELGPRVRAFQMGMGTKELYDELLSRVKSSRATARASIQKVKQIKEEGISLLKILEDNKRPAGKLRGKGSLRKMGVIKGKVMPETKRKTALARRILRVAGSSSTISNTTASRAGQVNQGIAKEAHKLRRQAQDQAAQSGSLRTRLDIMQGQLATQEEQAAAFKVKLQEDGTTAAKVLHETLAMGKEVKKAKQSLDRDLKQLTELLKTVESLQVDQVTEEMLNVTEAEMGALRWVIDQTLDQKLRELEAASDLQILKMKTIEKDMEDIEAEKLSLEDIVENLPHGCYNRVGF
ncbi:laminin subunit gamma-3-like [Chiloscyllium plagiosum]|uniref:laminin subunit gamma-3-like n=1 Tax=Chiloscyllium plagiosum TaxID=36176 RepID=UPI001CB8363F|nr:laminin subunit gamma-3-like [Chiloscyllium plagiosum]